MKVKFLKIIRRYTKTDKKFSHTNWVEFRAMRKKVKEYDVNWKEPMSRMDENYIPRLLYQYKCKDAISCVECPLKYAAKANWVFILGTIT